jgi:hypothetical protein
MSCTYTLSSLKLKVKGSTPAVTYNDAATGPRSRLFIIQRILIVGHLGNKRCSKAMKICRCRVMVIDELIS